MNAWLRSLRQGIASIGEGMASIGEGMATIGEGMASLLGSPPRPISRLPPDPEAAAADARALARDWERMVDDFWESLGYLPELGWLPEEEKGDDQ